MLYRSVLVSCRNFIPGWGPSLVSQFGRRYGVFPLFDLKKILFLHYLPFKLGWKIEIRYVHLAGALRCGVFRSILPPSRTNITIVYSALYRQNSLQFGQIGSVWLRIRYIYVYMSGNNLEPKYSHVQFCGKRR